MSDVTIYTASKTAHADKWKRYREAGYPVISTWIDEAGVGETTCFKDLWLRCIGESSRATVTILYREPGEILKGALVEAGAALSHGRRVLFVGDSEGLGSFLRHPLVQLCETLDEAFEAMVAQPPAGARP